MMQDRELMSLLMSRANGRARVPVHVVRRVHALLGDEDVEFADVDLNPGDRGAVSGEVVLFTSSRVIRAVLTETPREMGAPNADLTFSVEASTWGRGDLERIDLPAVRDPWENPDHAWAEREGQWPRNCHAHLIYGKSGTVRLPLSAVAADEVLEGLLPFLATLTADLA